MINLSREHKHNAAALLRCWRATPAARELVREVDYTLKTLAHSLLGQTRAEVAAADLPGRYESAQGLRGLLLLGESDAWLALGLTFQLSGAARAGWQG
jgi:hypothetical protein